MDLEFIDNKISISLSSKETDEFVAVIPDNVLREEVLKRAIFPSIDSTIVEVVNEPRSNSQDETDNSKIRRPIQKCEFMQYVSSRLTGDDERKVRAQKGTISRTWNGFIYLHNSVSYNGMDRNTIGINIPIFDIIHYNRYRVDIDRTDGLDMDQVARYLIRIADTIREHHIEGQPLNYDIARTVINKFMTSYSFVGCQFLCEFVAHKARQEGRLPADIQIEAIERAAKDFAAIVALLQTMKNGIYGRKCK